MVDTTTETPPNVKLVERAERRAPKAGGTTTHVYEQIRQAIADLTFEPGQRLQEAFLAEWLGVSRTPVREALRHLERDGLVAPSRARGVVVTQVTVEDVEQGFLLLEVLEGLACRLAAQRITDDDVPELRRLVDDLRDAEATGDLDRWAADDAELHDRIRSIAASHKLSEVTALVYPLIDRVRNMYLREGADPELRARLMADHVAMGEAILARDAEQAEALARALFAEGGKAIVALLRRWVSPLRRSF